MEPERLLFALRDVTHRLMAHVHATVAGHELAMPHVLALRAIDDEPGITHGALATRLGMTPGALTPTVQRLLDRGLVNRSKDPQDGRIHRLHLAAAGLAKKAEIQGQMRALLEDALADWAPDERDHLAQMLERLLGDLPA